MGITLDKVTKEIQKEVYEMRGGLASKRARGFIYGATTAIPYVGLYYMGKDIYGVGKEIVNLYSANLGLTKETPSMITSIKEQPGGLIAGTVQYRRKL